MREPEWRSKNVNPVTRRATISFKNHKRFKILLETDNYTAETTEQSGEDWSEEPGIYTAGA